MLYTNYFQKYVHAPGLYQYNNLQLHPTLLQLILHHVLIFFCANFLAVNIYISLYQCFTSLKSIKIVFIDSPSCLWVEISSVDVSWFEIDSHSAEPPPVSRFN